MCSGERGPCLGFAGFDGELLGHLEGVKNANGRTRGIERDGVDRRAKAKRAVLAEAKINARAHKVVAIGVIEANNGGRDEVAKIDVDFLIAAANIDLARFAQTRSDARGGAVFAVDGVFAQVKVGFRADEQGLANRHIDARDHTINNAVIVRDAGSKVVIAGGNANVRFHVGAGF